VLGLGYRVRVATTVFTFWLLGHVSALGAIKEEGVFARVVTAVCGAMFFPKDICIADFKANEENAGFGGDRVYYPSREWGDCDELNHVGSIGSYRKLAGPGDGRTTWIGFRSVAEAKSSNSQGGSFASVGEIDCDLRVLRWGKRLCKSYTFYRKPRSLIQMKTLDRGIERPHGGCLRSNPCTFCNASLSLGVPGLICTSVEETHWTRRAYGTREEVPA